MRVSNVCGIHLLIAYGIQLPTCCANTYRQQQNSAASQAQHPRVKIAQRQHSGANLTHSPAEKRAASKRRKKTRVAVCFVGQFLRGANGGKGVPGTRHRFAPGFGSDAIYDAFVATSTQALIF